MSTEAQPPTNDPSTGTDQPTGSGDEHIGGGGEAGIILGVIIVLGLIAFVGWLLYSRLRARRLGLPPPPLNPFSDRNRIPGTGSGGVIGWVREKIGVAQRKRTAGGAYEGDSLGGGGGFGGSVGRRSARSQRAFGGLDPDEAWDSRVGTEADGYGYEEQELSLRDQPAHDDEEAGYSGSTYGRVGASKGGAEAGRNGRGRRNELDSRYDEEMGGKGAARNPFDDAESSNLSLREISPIRHSDESTGTAERKSAFREAL